VYPSHSRLGVLQSAVRMDVLSSGSRSVCARQGAHAGLALCAALEAIGAVSESTSAYVRHGSIFGVHPGRIAAVLTSRRVHRPGASRYSDRRQIYPFTELPGTLYQSVVRRTALSKGVTASA
jgi:hypothetical protein